MKISDAIIQDTDFVVRKFLRKIDFNVNGCWIWKGHTTNCGRSHIRSKSKGISIQASKFSYILFVREIPEGLNVCHDCRPNSDNPLCVNPKHLWLGTQKENIKDRDIKLRQAFGERHGCAKLNKEQVTEIREIYSKGKTTQRKLAKIYNVSQNQICLITRLKAWKIT